MLKYSKKSPTGADPVPALKLAGQVAFPATLLPEIRLTHLYALFDDVGIIQHATFGIPDLKHGYSADDIGRALVVLCDLYETYKQEDLLRLLRTCLAFLRYAQTLDGHYHNFMSYDRRFLDEHGSEDTVGRVVWGLCSVIRHSPTAGMAMLAKDMLDKSIKVVANLEAPRGKAYAIAGLSLLAQSSRSAVYRELVHDLATTLWALYKRNQRDDWEWLEDTITYGNAKICESLMLAYEITGDDRFREAGLETLEFLLHLQWNGKYFDLVGNQGWCTRGGRRARFGQQPIDAGYLVEACVKAYEITQEQRYLFLAQNAFEWFLARNCHKVWVYDPQTGAVADGLDPQGASANAGAESVICFLLGLQSILKSQAVEKVG